MVILFFSFWIKNLSDFALMGRDNFLGFFSKYYFYFFNFSFYFYDFYFFDWQRWATILGCKQWVCWSSREMWHFFLIFSLVLGLLNQLKILSVVSVSVVSEILEKIFVWIYFSKLQNKTNFAEKIFCLIFVNLLNPSIPSHPYK